MLHGQEIDLKAMLAAREERAALQREMREKFHSPLVSFTLNIPGAVKTTPKLRKLFKEISGEICKELTAINTPILAQKEHLAATGDELIIAVDCDAQAIKAKTISIEENHPLGRLCDIDVLDADGKKLSRPAPRRCLICGGIAHACARSRRHCVEELTAKISQMLDEYFENNPA